MKHIRNFSPLMAAYRTGLRYSLTITVFVLVLIQISPVYLRSMILSIESTACMSEQVIHINKSRIFISNTQDKKYKILMLGCIPFFSFCRSVFVVWTGSLILLSGDIHPNPGPDNGNHLDHSSGSRDIYNFLNLPNHLSTVHYNVQSLANKVDVLISECSYFDLVSFPETWLDNSVSTQDLLFPTFHPPERKDRLSDRYGGVILYINA